jgi:hypothetical protein
VSARRVALQLSLLAFVVACASREPRARVPPPKPRSEPIAFAYGTPSGTVLGSATTRGRVTALLFVTTFDLPSQVMARRLDDVIRRHQPRANAGAVAIEAPTAAPLVEVFKSTLGLRYEVALSSTGNETNGPFGTIDRVPTLIVLDREGREVGRHHGVLEPEAIVQALRAAEPEPRPR